MSLPLTKKNNSLTGTIDEIVNHQYFLDRVSTLVTQTTESYLHQPEKLRENKYFMAENNVGEDLSNIISQTVQSNLKKVMNGELVTVSRDVMKVKQEMFKFVEEQTKITSNLRKELNRGLEEIRKKSLPQTNNGLIATRTNHRFSRHQTNGKAELGDKKHNFADIQQLKSSVESLRFYVDKGQNLTAITQQLNEFKIETKVAIEGLKHQIKKLSSEENKGEEKRLVNPKLKDSIDQAVKRTVKSQLTVYGSYAQQVSSLKNSLENIEQELNLQENKQHDYFSNQLKNVWKVINNLRDVQEQMANHIGFNGDDLM